MTTYKVTLLIEANGNPRKWLPETIEDSLYDDNEELIEWDITEVEK